MVDRSLLRHDPVSTPEGDDGPWFAPLRPTAAAQDAGTGLPPDRCALAGTLSARMWERLPR